MELKFFYKPGCPYCRRAEDIIAQLLREHPEYGKLNIRRIDETSEQELAGKYDYWYVPTFFLGEEKLYEADPTESAGEMREKLEGVFQRASKKS